MRFTSERRPPARKWRPFFSSLAVLTVAAPSLSHAFSFVPVPSPNLDLSDLGRIVIAGDFDGISLYQYETQTVSPPLTNGSEALLTEMPNGVLARFAGTDATIRTMCRLKLADGTQKVIMGGNFTSIDGIKSTAVALFDTNTTQFSPIQGLSGDVNVIMCDPTEGTAYVGGNFKVGNSSNAATWRPDRGWANFPFSGFNGPVNAITKTANGHIVFGGSFTGLGNVSAPNEPDAQVVNLSSANITAANTALAEGFNDPKAIICSDGSDGPGTTWLVEDGAPGIWEASFDFGFEPTKLRLWNTHLDGRGTKTFHLLVLPMNGIMNFTYVDPATGKNASCTNQCPLSNDPNVEYQDFQFVNAIGMNHFQIIISDFYGAGAGLAGIKLFEDNIFSYAVQEFNEPKDPSCGVTFPSTAAAVGPWTISYSILSDSSYLAAKLAAPITSQSASITFTPNIRQPGNYSINMYTPGCIPDNTCATRGRVNITGIMSSEMDHASFATSIWQTNYYDKYDQIYFGYVDGSSDDFRPSVTVTPLDGQDLAEMTLVAQKIGFTLINATGGFNGLFDYDPSMTVFDVNKLDNDPINKLSASFNHSSRVRALATAGNVTYIGGKFSSASNQNLMAIDSNNQTITLDGGLDGEVVSMYLQGDQLFVGGEFTNKQTNEGDGFNHVAMYNAKDRSWHALGAGVDGRVDFVSPFQVNISNNLEAAVAFTGSFSECNAFGHFEAIPADGFAVWILSKKNWLPNLNVSAPGYSGSVTSCLLNVTGSSSLCAGSLSSAEIGAYGAATLTSKGLGQLPVKIQSQGQDSGSGKKRRDVSSPTQVSGVATGAFYNEGNNNLTVLAGHFSTQAADGSPIYNLLFIDGKNNDAVRGLGSGVSPASSFTTLAFHGSVLFAGGAVNGTVNGADVNGIIAYDVVSKSFSKAQPAAVSGGDGVVSAISVRQGTSEVYVGGSFKRVGALDCPGVCLYDAAATQWVRPGSNLEGRVKALLWYSKTQLVAGGDLRANGSETTYLAMYDVKKKSWTRFAGADQIPGPVDVVTPASSDNSKLWVSGSARNGSVFLMQYDGRQWQMAEQLPPAGSVIQSLQVFTLTKAHDKTDLVAEDQMLMLTGSIPFANVGSAGAVLYNGTDYQPYALATGKHDGAGSIAKIFSQKDNFFTADEKHMPLVFVVLIGLAVSLALILLMVMSGIALDRLRKRREGYMPAPTSMYDRGSGIQRIPPRELLEEMGKSRPLGGAPQV